MKKNNLLLFVLFTVCLWDLFAQLPSNDPHWQLVWSDEFNNATLNNNDWEVKDNCDHGGSSHAIFTNRNDNVEIINGNLVIRLKQENYQCNPFPSTENGTCGYCVVQNHNFTSGWVETKQIRDIQYGFIEARIKLPFNELLHPAFWTFNGHNLSSGNPYNEIDIFEMIPGQSQGGISNHTNYHMTTNVHVDSARGFGKHAQVNYINDYTQWHTYAIEWSPSRILWYIDGNIVRNSDNYFYNSDGIFNPNRIIFNIGLDGVPSVPIPNQEMLIDYVREYQLITDCNELINSCFYNFNTYDNKVKNSITIGSGGCSNNVAQGSFITLRASEFIQFEGDLTIPIGTNLYADVHKNCPNTLSIECTNIFNRCQYNFLGYDNLVKKEISLGGSGCNVSVDPINTNILLQATQKITINKGTTITPQQSNYVELSITNCP